MIAVRRKAGAWALWIGLLVVMPATAADLIENVEGVYAARQLRHTPFDPRTAEHLTPAESRFLEALFSVTDEAGLLNANVNRWFRSDGTGGLHAADYRDRMDALRVRLGGLETPNRVLSVRDLISESLTLQLGFVNDWYAARDAGAPFESQLTDEYAYHEGLHRSHRLILKAFAELRALFPEIGESSQMAFLDHLRAMDLK